MPNNQPQQYKNQTIWIILVVVVVTIAIYGIWIAMSNENGNTNTNTNTTANQNDNINKNVNAMVNENTNSSSVELLPGSIDGWMKYVHNTPDYQFEYPDYLSIQPNYSNRLIQSEDENNAVSFIKVSIIGSEIIVADGGSEKFVEGIALEFPGTFKEESEAITINYNNRSFVKKAYLYHASLDETGDYTKKETLLFTKFSNDSDGLLLKILGENSSVFDDAVDRIVESLEF